ncbi:TrlF family AAA-like ATPase [Bacillus sp. EAC]|uniref:TrlF family AAA-like ATPase n=1 Tax=Bacillus sp. EAC TaxID=1978338 RepID=UPI000B443AA7|nr:hypothetical protein [Bacillus sp. EAC]
MNQLINTSGSIWKKWDLHVHSPASKLNNQFGEWDEYLQTLEGLSDISVLGITDYYSIEGYLRVKQYKDIGGLANIDLILPNIELRIDTVTTRDRPINLHIIFSPNVVEHIEDKFLRELKYEYGGRTFSCTNSDLINLGKLVNSTLSDEAALREGMNQFKVSIPKLEDVLQQNRTIFSGHYMTIVANKETDGASGLRDTSMRIEQQKIYQFADAIFSSRAGDRKFFLGQIEGYSKELIIERFGSLKPCIHGSDAHSIEKICKPDLNRFTWIKADPSFQGLIQIIHEPEYRVIVQENHPDTKSDYNVIDSVSFFNNEIFTEEEIKLNPGLNTIIGGKSSGKSLLLYKIAQAISLNEVESRSNENHWKNPYSNSFIDTVDFKVNWRNNDTSTNSENKGKVTYIPQMYINSLSEEAADEDLQKKIREILIQKEDNARFLTEKRELINNINSAIRQNIIKMFEKIDELEVVKQEIEKIGEKEAIRKEQSKLQLLIDEKFKSSSLSQTDETEMKDLEKQSHKILEEIEIQKFNIDKVDTSSRELNIILDDVNSKLKILCQNLNEDTLQVINNLQLDINSAFLKAQNDLTDNKTNFITLKQTNINQHQEITNKLNPFLEKIKELSDITDLKSRVTEQVQLLKQIDEQLRKKTECESILNQLKQNILGGFKENFTILTDFKSYFDGKAEFENLSLSAGIIFDQSKFQDSFLSLFNRRGRITNVFQNTEQLVVFNDNDEFLFDETTYINKIEYLFYNIIQKDYPSLKLKQSFTKQQAIEALLSTTTTKIIYDLTKDEDNLTQMSPGKRGLVLLELFLEMSEDKHPILIDQPEDNLDNRTISKELVKIIKSKKEKRQIIIVTHNANLVVLTDAENVIVANQDVQLQENHTRRFEYLSGSLECDFLVEGSKKITSKGIKSHVCEILEGGQEAFEIREKKYGF